MKKILTLVLLLFVMNSFPQLVQWQLTVDGSPTINTTHLYAGNFTGGSSVSITYGSSGAYASGWPTGGLSPTDFYQIAIAPDTGYKLTITDISYSERRSLTGIRNYEVRYAFGTSFSAFTTLVSDSVPDNDLERDTTISGMNLIIYSGDTLYIRWYGYAAESAAGTWRMNNDFLSINGSITVANPNDITSEVVNPASQIPGGTISSLSTTVGSAVPVFSFKINDLATADSKPTYVTLITINNQHPTGEATWTSDIQGVILNDGTQDIITNNISISNNQITFSIDSGNLVVPNSGSVTLTLSVYLNAGGLNDNTTFQFKIDSINQGFDAAIGGSGFAPIMPQTILSNLFTLDVQATKLVLINYPNTVWQNADFQVSVQATDVYQNVDTDNVLSVSVSLANGNGNISSVTGLTQMTSQGQVNWTDIQYDSTDYFQLKFADDASILAETYSSIITVSQVYDTIIDDFSDGDLLVNPVWTGNTSAFISSTGTNPQLVLYTYTGSADTAYIAIPFKNQYDSIEWQLYVNLLFSPSDNNYARYYLVSNNDDLKAQTTSGFYLQFGENGTADAIALYYQTSLGNSQLICRGTDGTISTNPFVRVKIIYTKSTHQWRLYSDYSGQFNFMQEAVGTDTLSNFPSIHYVGIFTQYTSSNDENKMFFDDVYAGPVLVDTIAPTIESVRVVDSLHIDVSFSEGIITTDAENVNNYLINNGIGTPISAQQDSFNLSVVHIALTVPLINETNYSLIVSQVTDYSGNTSSNLIAYFLYYLPKFNDIVINEIMADPTPSVGLPDYEYIELYNNANYSIDLSDWTITIGTNTKTLDNEILNADSFLIITSTDGTIPLSAYGNTIGLIGNSDLTNAGQTIILRNLSGQIISLVTYDDGWYKNTYKASGGWSLERIDPNNACEGYDNWAASNDNLGGTPGKINSIFASNSDNTSPTVLRATVLSNDTISVFFSEQVDSSMLSNPLFYTADHGLGNPFYAKAVGPDYKKVILGFSQSFTPGVIYTLSVNNTFQDCQYNTLGNNNTCQFAIPSLASQGDIIINEVLYNPLNDGVDYVELYNNSTHTVDLATLKLANKDDADTSNIKNICDIAPEGYLLFPGYFALLSTNGHKVLQQYYSPNPNVFIDMSDFPSLSNDQGNVLLMDLWTNTIDYFEYIDAMQFPLLNSSDGVSLERINYNKPTNDADNWHSASFSVGYGTPGYKNSQYHDESDNTDEFTLSSNIVSPDNDGYQDILEINYLLPKSGYVANIDIFDVIGRKIKKLTQNKLLGTSGTIIWNGVNESNERIRAGAYIILIEVFDIDGNVKHYKKNVVVAYKY